MPCDSLESADGIRKNIYINCKKDVPEIFRGCFFCLKYFFAIPTINKGSLNMLLIKNWSITIFINRLQDGVGGTALLAA